MVAIFCNRLLADEPVTIFGDGRQTRDYVFVEDVVDAFVAGGEHPDAPGARLNIGTGSRPRCWSCTRPCGGSPGSRASRSSPQPGERAGPDRPGLRRAGRVLGWRAQADLADGLARTWAWAFQEVNAGSVGG